MMVDSITEYGHQTIDIPNEYIPENYRNMPFGVALVFLKGNPAEQRKKFEAIRKLLFGKE